MVKRRKIGLSTRFLRVFNLLNKKDVTVPSHDISSRCVETNASSSNYMVNNFMTPQRKSI